MKRTQIYLDEDQDGRLGEKASAEGVTKSALIRRAIEEFLHEGVDAGRGLARLKHAVREAAGIAPYLPEGGRYVEEVQRADVERQRELERSRRA